GGRLRAQGDRDRVRPGHDRRRRDRDRPRERLRRARDPDGLPACLRAAPAGRRGRTDPLLPGQQLDVSIPLSIVLFVPLLTGFVGAFLPRDGTRWAALIGTLIVLAYVV